MCVDHTCQRGRVQTRPFPFFSLALPLFDLWDGGWFSPRRPAQMRKFTPY